METGLLPADSDSIKLLEWDLLEALTTVNDDKCMEMAIDLLDLELEPMTLSQFTPLPSVIQGVLDSQVFQGWVLQELCCKYPWRSNNNSALLDITIPALTGAPSSPEIVLDDDPVPERQPSPASGTSSAFPKKLPAILLRHHYKTTNPGCEERLRPLDLSSMPTKSLLRIWI